MAAASGNLVVNNNNNNNNKYIPAAAAAAAAPPVLSPPPPPAAAAATAMCALVALPAPLPSLTTVSSSLSSSSSPSSSSSSSTKNRKRKTTETTAAAAAATAAPQAGHGAVPGCWNKDDDDKLRAAVRAEGPKNWKLIAQEHFGGMYNDTQCLNRWYKVLRPGLVKGHWTKEEDDIIMHCMQAGITKWAKIAERIPGRLGKQCRERYLNHLDPTIKKGEWSAEEDELLVAAYTAHGSSWTKVADCVPGRSENAVKNRWNSAYHVKARQVAREQAVPPPSWDEALECMVVKEYCQQQQQEQQQQMDTTALMDSLVDKLRAANPSVYGAIGSMYSLTLHKRLRLALETEARQQGTETALYRTIFGTAATGKKRNKRKPKQVIETTMAPPPPAAAAAAAAVKKPIQARLSIASSSSPPPPPAAAAAVPTVEQACTKRSRIEDDDMAVEGEEEEEVMKAPQQQQQQQQTPLQSMDVCTTTTSTMLPRRSSSVTYPVHHNHYHGLHGPTHDEEDTISSISAMSSEASLDTEDERDTENMLSPNPASTSPPLAAAAAVLKKTKTTTTTKTNRDSLSFGGSCGGLSNLALAVSSLCSPSTSMDTSACSNSDKSKNNNTKVQPPIAPVVVAAPVVHSPSKRLRDIISLLFSAMRDEADFTRRGLLQDALDAATQELPPMVNFVEGVLGGSNCGGFSLAVEADRQFILDQLMTATHRGVFGPRNHSW